MNIKILNQEASYEDSMRILKENGLEPLTYQEALANSEFFIKEFKGKWKWFYLKGVGIDKDGTFTFSTNGNLKDFRKETNPNKIVRVWSGDKPLSLIVGSDDDVARYGGRFGLYADDDPSYVAPVVCGKVSDKTLLKPYTYPNEKASTILSKVASLGYAETGDPNSPHISGKDWGKELQKEVLSR